MSHFDTRSAPPLRRIAQALGLPPASILSPVWALLPVWTLLSVFCTPGAAAAQTAVAETAAAQAVEAATADDLATLLDAYMRQRVEEQDFSGSVLVARAGVPILSAGYGMANREHGVPCTPKTKYRIGSITKQFTAAAVMRLVDQGEIDVRDELELFLPDLPDAWHPITVHQLLCHQSGLFNVTNQIDYMNWARLPGRPGKTIERVFDLPLDFEPGTRFSYSNTGYLTLALVVEEVGGTKWERFLRRELLDPLGMKDTGHDRNDTILPHRADGYQEFGDKVFNAAFHDMSVPIGGGDLYATTEDLLRWDVALHEGDLLSEGSVEAMTTVNKGGYGYGLMMGSQMGRDTISHGGGIFGFRSYLGRFADEGVTLIVLSNAGWSSPGQIASDLAELVFAP